MVVIGLMLGDGRKHLACGKKVTFYHMGRQSRTKNVLC